MTKQTNTKELSMNSSEYTAFVQSEALCKIRRNGLNTLTTGATLPLNGDVMAKASYKSITIFNHKTAEVLIRVNLDMVEYYDGVLKTLQAIHQEGMVRGQDYALLAVSMNAVTTYITKGYKA